MTPLIEWQVLAGIPHGTVLRTERALRGKVHRIRTDYRWIAHSAGVSAPLLESLESLTLGWEDRPRRLFAWAPIPGGYVAMAAYPSRARDADGRAGGLEKQYLVCQPERSGLSPAAIALCLLPVVAALPESVDAKLWGGAEWEDSGYRYTFPVEDCPQVSCDPETLRAQLERGVAELALSVGRESLEMFYDRLLRGKRPSLLTDLQEDLTPLALAALLIPLPHSLASSFSMASEAPVRTFDAVRFGNWSAVARNDTGEVVASGLEAKRMAAIVLDGPARQDTVTQAAPKETAVTFLSKFLKSRARRFPRIPPDVQLSCTEEEAFGLIDEIRAFEATTTDLLPEPERRIAQARHLAVKAGLARAFLYAIAPYDSVIDQLPPNPDSPIEPLYFVHVAGTAGWRGHLELSAERLHLLISGMAK